MCGACFALLSVSCSSIKSVDLLPDHQRIVHWDVAFLALLHYVAGGLEGGDCCRDRPAGA